MERHRLFLRKWPMTSLVLLGHEIGCKYTKASIVKAITDLQMTRKHHWLQLGISPI